MVEETGTVIQVEGDIARVLVQKKSACDGCSAQGACKTTDAGMEIEAVNAARAKEGQTVKVMMGPQQYLKGSIMIYGIPLVLFIAGAIAGKNLGDTYLSQYNSDLIAACTGFLFLFLSFLGVRIWSRRLESSVENRPVIEKIVQ
jgi:sigma-E factor negative regulatory protein RseC